MRRGQAMARVCGGGRDDSDDASIHMGYHGTDKQHLVSIGGGEQNGASRKLGGGPGPGDQVALDAYYAVIFSIDRSSTWFYGYFSAVRVSNDRRVLQLRWTVE